MEPSYFELDDEDRPEEPEVRAEHAANVDMHHLLRQLSLDVSRRMAIWLKGCGVFLGAAVALAFVAITSFSTTGSSLMVAALFDGVAAFGALTVWAFSRYQVLTYASFELKTAAKLNDCAIAESFRGND